MFGLLSAKAFNLAQIKLSCLSKGLNYHFKVGFAQNIFNPLPNKILDMINLKAFADDQLNVTKMMIFLLDRVENTMEKGGNAGY